MRLSFEVTKDVMTKTSGQSKIDFKDIDIQIDNSKVQIQSQSQAFNEHGHGDEVKNWVKTKLAEEIHQLRKEAFAGRDDIVAKLPALSLAPMIGLYFAAFGADKMAFTDQFIEYEFSPVSLKLVKPKSLYEDFLKALDTEFAPQEEGENPSAIQIILDENLINGFIG